MAALQNIGPFYRGEDDAPSFTMTPLTDITAWTIVFNVKALASDPTALLTVNATLTSPASGIFTVPLSAAQTATLSAGDYAYDVWRTDSGSAACLALGTITLKGTVRVR